MIGCVWRPRALLGGIRGLAEQTCDQGIVAGIALVDQAVHIDGVSNRFP